MFRGFIKQQQWHENRKQHPAGLRVEGVFRQHGEKQHQYEGEIDERDAFRHTHKWENQQETEI